MTCMVAFDRIALCHDKLASMPPVLYITSWCGASINRPSSMTTGIKFVFLREKGDVGSKKTYFLKAKR